MLTIEDVLRAGRAIRPYLRPTPLHSYPALNRLLGMELYVKHENHSLIGSFKARGAINALAQHREAGRVVAYSTGNHGQGVSYAAALLGMEATIVVPEGANREKVAAIEALGGRVVFHGRTLDETQRRTRELVAERGAYYADDGGDLLIAAGAGTVALEILEEVPDLEWLVIPLGDGMLAGGCCVVLRALAPRARSLAVQSEACPAMYESWRSGEVVYRPCGTFAEGLADVQPHAEALELLRAVLDEALLVSEQEIRAAIRTLLRLTHNLAEGAGAAPLAACLKQRERLAGRKVAMILSGGNLDTRLLPDLLREE